MTKEEYDKIELEIENRKKTEMSILRKTFALSNNPYEIGDIIKDHANRIQIGKIKITTIFSSKYPCCVYEGIKLKKDLTPFKSQEKAVIFQINIIEED
ncbi:MAG: hypothetical protein ACFFDN_04840 [Candidatus Hodarchaeota archaeon]